MPGMVMELGSNTIDESSCKFRAYQQWKQTCGFGDQNKHGKSTKKIER
jgi:hypothetical protein